MLLNINNNGYSINASGNLSLRNVDLVELSKLSSGRPVYVLDEIQIRKNVVEFQDALTWYPRSSCIFYACKALQNLGICRIMDQLGIGLDVCSYGEMMVANAAKFPFSRVILHGNNKSIPEIEYAIGSKIKLIVIDSESEYILLDEICQNNNYEVSVLVRVNPDIIVHTHKYIATGVGDSKFGIKMGAESTNLIKRIIQNPRIRFAGLHSHIGSQITDPRDMHEANKALAFYIHNLSKEGIKCETLNIGGGIGIKYQATDLALSISHFMKETLVYLVESLKALNLDLPELMIEPGRAIIGGAGCTIYKIGSIKQSTDGTLFAAVNGGMTDNIRTALYQASYSAMVANDALRDGPKLKYKIVGNCCESGDVLIYDIELPELVTGDTLVIFCTGAYNASMSSNFNKHNFPGTVLVNEGRFDWIVKEEPIEDLMRYDLIPPHLL